MATRRKFIRETGLSAASFLLAHPLLYAKENEAKTSRLTILHTNDVHSRMEPFPMDGGPNAGRGGIAARAALINKIRSETENVLLLDAGDIFQGTPYFNIFKGELHHCALPVLRNPKLTIVYVSRNTYSVQISGIYQAISYFVIINPLCTVLPETKLLKTGRLNNEMS